MAGLIPFNRKRNDQVSSRFDDFSNMLDDFFLGGWPSQRSLAGDTFKIDIQDNEKEYVIEAEVPGVKKEDIDIALHDEKLTLSIKKEEMSESSDKNYIHRERKYANMSRSILLADADDEGVIAKLDEGVLSITIPKKERIDTSKRIMIE